MDRPPTEKQLRDLKALARRTGMAAGAPLTTAQASRRIEQLRSVERLTPFERRLATDAPVERRRGPDSAATRSRATAPKPASEVGSEPSRRSPRDGRPAWNSPGMSFPAAACPIWPARARDLPGH